MSRLAQYPERAAFADAAMPKILRALEAAYSAAWKAEGDGADQRELGALIDSINDWCWCEVDHSGSCPPVTP